jgi:hypothetical protein
LTAFASSAKIFKERSPGIHSERKAQKYLKASLKNGLDRIEWSFIPFIPHPFSADSSPPELSVLSPLFSIGSAFKQVATGYALP